MSPPFSGWQLRILCSSLPTGAVDPACSVEYGSRDTLGALQPWPRGRVVGYCRFQPSGLLRQWSEETSWLAPLKVTGQGVGWGRAAATAPPIEAYGRTACPLTPDSLCGEGPHLSHSDCPCPGWRSGQCRLLCFPRFSSASQWGDAHTEGTACPRGCDMHPVTAHCCCSRPRRVDIKAGEIDHSAGSG